jgi:hypothetical protein
MDRRAKNDLQNTTQKTKDLATRTSLKIGRYDLLVKLYVVHMMKISNLIYMNWYYYLSENIYLDFMFINNTYTPSFNYIQWPFLTRTE